MTILKRLSVPLAAIALASCAFVSTAHASTADGTIDGTNKYAWGADTGWVNFGNAGGNVHVTNAGVTGYAWSANQGWINLHPTTSGVHNDGTGVLSGYAWGEGLGWINFTGVSINGSGVFTGQATVSSDNTKISFDCAGCTVKTDWRSSSDGTVVVDGDSVSDLLTGGTFTPDPGSPATSTPSITVQDPVRIEIGSGGVTSTVEIPDNTVITRADGGNFDATTISGDVPSNSTLSGLDEGVVVRGKLRWGVPNLGLVFSNPITLKVWVGAGFNGQTLTVQRSVAGNRWTTDGIVAPGTCVVTDGFCTFQTTKASYFIVASTVAVDHGGGGSSGGILGTTAPASNPVVSPTPTTTAITPPITATSDVAVDVSASGVVMHPENLETIRSLFPTITADSGLETKYLALVKADAKEFGIKLNATEEKAITNFVAYGISRATVKLGTGERCALIRDYFQTVGWADVRWDDIERLAIGQKVKGRNLGMEKANVGKALAYFRIMYHKDPNFKNAEEDLVWNTLLYRTRFTRDLAKERTGITKFKLLFFRTPSIPMEWAAVRGLGYVKK